MTSSNSKLEVGLLLRRRGCHLENPRRNSISGIGLGDLLC